MYSFKKIGMNEKETVKELFTAVFTLPPWNDDWSDKKQLDLYITDLMNQNNSLAYGLFENDSLVCISLGHIKHWFTGTEYCIDEFCVRTGKQSQGIGTYFIKEIENSIKELGLVQIFLQTDSSVPAYHFYKRCGFIESTGLVSFGKQLN